MKTLKQLKEEVIKEIEATTEPYQILMAYNILSIPEKRLSPQDIADFEEEENEID